MPGVVGGGPMLLVLGVAWLGVMLFERRWAAGVEERDERCSGLFRALNSRIQRLYFSLDIRSLMMKVGDESSTLSSR